MAKKVYDILPPKVAHNVENAVKGMGLAQKPKRMRGAGKSAVPKNAKEKRFPLKELLVGGTAILALLGIYLFTTLPRVDIMISPATEVLQTSSTITADTSQTTVDTAKKIVPARYVEEQKEGSREFAATGSASNDGKAAGTIRVYNKVSPSTPIVLKAGTHFLSDSGKYFLTLERITIPAMQGKTAGSISVKVEAEESGEAHNIGPSKFSVPKLSGTVYYYGIWAESTVDMAGGKTGNVKKATADDIDGAKAVLTEALLAEAEASLRSKLGSDEVVLDGIISRSVVSASANVKANAVVENFTQTATVKVAALVVNKKDLEALVKAELAAKLPEGKTYLQESLDVEYAAEAVNIPGGSAKIGITARVTTYHAVNANDLIDKVANKSADEITNAVTAKYGDKVLSIKVNFWPFWVDKAPSDKDKIIINLNFE